jgi:uncharacterized protein (TIGR00661 family)
VRILICPCGEGFGHTMRCIAAARELEKRGYEVYFAAYKTSKRIIEENFGFEVFDTHAEISLTGKEGKFDFKRSALNSKKILYNLVRAAHREYKLIKNLKIDMMISDSKYSALFAAKLENIPSILIINQNRIRPKGKTRMLGYFIGGFLNVFNRLADVIIVPDFPPPYTVCEYNLKNLEKLVFTGPLIQYDSKKYEKEKRFILSLIGGFGYRLRILKFLNRLAEKREDLEFKLICGTAKPKGLKRLKNIDIIRFEKNMGNLFARAEIVVAHAGHSTLMEILCFGKPCIIIPDLNHPEQENNAKKIEELGCGIVLSHRNLSQKRLENAIERIRNDKSYEKNARKMSKLSEKFNGRRKIIDIVENLG